MAQEIERKYLALIAGDIAPQRTRIIESGYISAQDPEVRIARYRGVFGSYQITVKKGKGLTREEIVVDVDDEKGLALFNLTDQKVAKVRDDIPTVIPARYRRDDGTPGLWEVDTYLGRLQGLTVAEIELPSASSAVPEAPKGVVLLKEVTENSLFKNKALATLSSEGIQELLDEYNEVVTDYQQASAKTKSLYPL